MLIFFAVFLVVNIFFDGHY